MQKTHVETGCGNSALITTFKRENFLLLNFYFTNNLGPTLLFETTRIYAQPVFSTLYASIFFYPGSANSLLGSLKLLKIVLF